MVIAKNWPFLPNYSTTVILNEVNKYLLSISFLGFPGKVVKNSCANAGDVSLIPGSGRSPGGGNGNPLQYSSLEKYQGQKSLEGSSSWGPKESDTTGLLSTRTAVLVNRKLDVKTWLGSGWIFGGKNAVLVTLHPSYCIPSESMWSLLIRD